MAFPYVPDVPLCSTNIREASDAGIFLHRLDDESRSKLFKQLLVDLESFDARYLSTVGKDDPEGTLERIHAVYRRLVRITIIYSFIID